MTHRTIINLQTGEIKQVDLTQEELNQIQIKKTAWNNGEFNRAISDLRSKRNKLLADSDYIILADSPIPSVKKSEFMNYRTALRNLTQGLDTVEKINNVAYPLKPQI
jgi:hypothetical protein